MSNRPACCLHDHVVGAAGEHARHERAGRRVDAKQGVEGAWSRIGGGRRTAHPVNGSNPRLSTSVNVIEPSGAGAGAETDRRSQTRRPLVTLIVPEAIAIGCQETIVERVVLSRLDVVRAGAGAERRPGAARLVHGEGQVVAAVAAAAVRDHIAERRVAGQCRKRQWSGHGQRGQERGDDADAPRAAEVVDRTRSSVDGAIRSADEVGLQTFRMQVCGACRKRSAAATAPDIAETYRSVPAGRSTSPPRSAAAPHLRVAPVQRRRNLGVRSAGRRGASPGVGDLELVRPTRPA